MTKKKSYQLQKLICKYPEPKTFIDKLRNYYCRFLAIFRFEKARHLCYCHEFLSEDAQKSIIVSSPIGFRAYEPDAIGFSVNNEMEEVYPDGVLVKSKCRFCGLESYRWYTNFENYNEIENPEE